MSSEMKMTQEIFTEWWLLLKEEEKELEASGWSHEKWQEVYDKAEAWRYRNTQFPFTPRLEMLLMDILQWIGEEASGKDRKR